MKNIKRIALILTFSTILTSLTACGQPVIDKVQEQGIISSVELDKAEEEDTITPTYDINSIEDSTKIIDFIEKDSYYKQFLDTRNMIAYNEIKDALNNYKTEVLLSKNITAEELFKIMTIMYLDDPIMFQMKTQYDYYLDSNEYVYKVNLYYSMSEISYKSSLDRIKNDLLKNYSFVTGELENNATEYATYQLILKNYLEIMPNTKDYGTTVEDFLNGKRTNHSFSKYFALVCRYLGLDTTIIIGKYTNDNLSDILTKDSGFNISSYEDIKNKYTTVTDEEGSKRYTVKYNFDNYVMWNLVKINDSWHHLDHMTGSYIAGNDANFLNLKSNSSMLHYVNDYTISMSRIYYYNDILLGSTPLCDSNQFQTSYRNNQYLLSHTEEQMLTFLTSTVQILQSRKTKSIIYQFEDEETYNYFLNNFDMVVKTYNNSTIDQIINYRIGEFRETLTIVINDFKYK
jgi:hypothetical protein